MGQFMLFIGGVWLAIVLIAIGVVRGGAEV
jgi:hypothetical protein